MSRRAWFVLLILTVLGCVCVGEWYLGAQKQRAMARQPNYWRLQAAHAPFAAKHAHEVYGFFFPSDPPRRAALSNETVHLSEGGFRGPGPDDAGRRGLAFLVGNSAVFGFVPHDSLTITGYLNRMQSRYHFVNAGVPSWTSHQMRERVNRELLAYRPELIVVWGGYNDASLALRTARSGGTLAPGMTESSTDRASEVKETLVKIFPNLTAYVARALARTPRETRQEPPESVAVTAGAYFTANVDSAFRQASAHDVQFLAVYQPVLQHHAHRPSGIVSHNDVAFFESFHRSVIARVASIPLLDLSNWFDQAHDTIPVFRLGGDADLDAQVFVDTVHLYAPGNRAVAAAIIAALGIPRSPEP